MKSRQIRKTHQDVVDTQITLHKIMKYLIETDPTVKREKEEEFRIIISIALLGQEARPFELRCGDDGVFRVAQTLGGTIDKLIDWSQKGEILNITQGLKTTTLDMRDAWSQVYEMMVDCFPEAKELGVKMSAETPVREKPTSFTFDAENH
jgi:sugar phosphate isomerase/epimerase